MERFMLKSKIHVKKVFVDEKNKPKE